LVRCGGSKIHPYVARFLGELIVLALEIVEREGH